MSADGLVGVRTKKEKGRRIHMYAQCSWLTGVGLLVVLVVGEEGGGCLSRLTLLQIYSRRETGALKC